MRLQRLAIAALALAIPAGVRAQVAPDAPVCRATLERGVLTTSIRFTDGYLVEAPWRVLWNKSGALHNGQQGMLVGANLDRIIEREGGAGQRSTRFPSPVQATFEGQTENDLLFQAAQVWCFAVLKASEGGAMAMPVLPAPRNAPAARATD